MLFLRTDLLLILILNGEIIFLPDRVIVGGVFSLEYWNLFLKGDQGHQSANINVIQACQTIEQPKASEQGQI